MGVINLARVDERLIHGQVMMTLSQNDRDHTRKSEVLLG